MLRSYIPQSCGGAGKVGSQFDTCPEIIHGAPDLSGVNSLFVFSEMSDLICVSSLLPGLVGIILLGSVSIT